MLQMHDRYHVCSQELTSFGCHLPNLITFMQNYRKLVFCFVLKQVDMWMMMRSYHLMSLSALN
ncbi:hypothetical protein BRADI_3g13393v3 [Brachypodium distachyon]|uniref:Uncharacterized protein n=1 Tax=Brachypodium distachyon TaxID=15368 RepID=A0A2K2CWV5_BRADI|nr:hypothetical protein BRADI_3g13393v3 [Brachypodium distachyon]